MQHRLCFLKREVFSILCDAVHLIVKRWSRWSSRAEVQQWDTHPEPTELRLSGSLTESTWTQKIQIEFVDTKNQLADVLTQGNVTRDEWNHLRHLFIFSIFSSASCPEAIVEKDATRTQEKRENCGKVEADVEPDLAECGKLFYSAEFECVKTSGDTQCTQSTRFESHSTTCKRNLPLEVQIKMTLRRVLKCGYQMQKRTTVRKNSLLQERTRIWVFKNVQGSLPQKNSEIIDDDDSKWPNNYHISRAWRSTPRDKSTRICDNDSNCKPEDKMGDLDVNTLIWGMFMTVTQQAAVHLGHDVSENLHSTKNQPQR